MAGVACESLATQTEIHGAFPTETRGVREAIFKLSVKNAGQGAQDRVRSKQVLE
jgi:hypothetical protein